MGFLGFPCTWEHSRNSEVVLRKRLDRGLASDLWFQMCPNHLIRHISTAISDRDSLLIQERHVLRAGNSFFHFNNDWRLCEGY